ncbi:hypothetical protein MR988_04110 [bacterium]|nr:hypothetical protein [bacterium]
MNYFDMHSHILPGVDDGCKTVEQSLELINIHLKNGVKNICLTPHYYSNEISLEDFADARDEAFEKLKPRLPEGVTVCLGAEVYVSKYLFNNSDISRACYGKSRYMLTEFPYNSSFTGKSLDKLLKIRDNYGITPIIPHIERYPNVFEDEGTLEELTDMGVIIQTNVSSFEKFFRRNRILKLIDRGLIHILGTDAHSLNRGNPDLYLQACGFIRKKCGEERLVQMQKTAEEIFSSAL